MQDIMSEHSGMPLCDDKMEEKFIYKRMLFDKDTKKP